MDWSTGAQVLAGMIVGGITGEYIRRLRSKIAWLKRMGEFDFELAKTLSKRLTNLRANAFLTNEHGHRVRYSKASAEVRARAEAGE